MTEHADHSRWRARLKRLVPWLLGAVVLCLGLLGAATLLLQTVLTAETVEERLNDELARSTDGQYRVTVEDVNWSLWRRSVRVREVRLRPGSTAVGDAAESGSSRSGTQYRGRLSSLQLSGIHLWPLVWRGELSVNEVTVRRPDLHIERGETEDEGDQKNASSAVAAVQSRLVDRLSRTWVRRLVVREGTVVAGPRDSTSDAAVPTDSLWGIRLAAEGIRIDSASRRDRSRLLFSDHLRLSVDGYRHLSEDRLYRMRLDSAHASSSDSSLTIEALNVGPTVSDSVFMRRHGFRVNRFEASVGRVDLEGVDYREAIDGSALLVRTAHLDSLQVDAYRDNRRPPPPTDPPPKMPHELIQSLEHPVRVDTIRVTHGRARYERWDEGAAGSGHIAFDRITATIHNVTNDPRRMGSSTPAVVRATTRVAGDGWLKTTIRVPLLSSDFALSYEGSLGPMDAQSFNDAFVYLSGIRIERGQVERLQFSAEVREGRAEGTVRGRYHDLSVEMLDEETGDRGLRKRLESFVLDDLMLNSESQNDDSDPRTGSIEHEHDEDHTFFKFLWHSLRSGLFSLLGL